MVETFNKWPLFPCMNILLESSTKAVKVPVNSNIHDALITGVNAPAFQENLESFQGEFSSESPL